jgi:transposase
MDTLVAVRYNKAHMNKNKTNIESDQSSKSEPVPVASAKRYDEAFKRQAVEHWIKSGQRGTQVAAEMGISYPSLKDWKRRYWGDAMPGGADLAAENRALKAELARVREQRDILKKTLGILSEPSKNAINSSKA